MTSLDEHECHPPYLLHQVPHRGCVLQAPVLSPWDPHRRPLSALE